MKRALSIILAGAVLVLSACVNPAARWPGGDGELTDPDGNPLDVEVLAP